ncbi:hypothetical protein [Lacrimispora amygdalina]|uniref:hypothetical protein n=1 Tax=Lacrimispora amygdalina TaxID=253257 RepID=UPI001A9A3E55|nr:hypothetical protein [Lacrimispora amygdalina]
MDITSQGSYPANKLSNFTLNAFVLDGVECASMEGFLQSLKFCNPAMQVEICRLAGKGAKKAGANKRWRQKQTLYWRGLEYKRNSNEYQELLDRAFNELVNSLKRAQTPSKADLQKTHLLRKH